MYNKNFNYGYVDIDGKINLINRSDKTATPNDEWDGVATAPFHDKNQFMAELKDMQKRRKFEIANS
jgi:hypothetical protein